MLSVQELFSFGPYMRKIMQYISYLLLLVCHGMFVSRSLPGNRSICHNTIVINFTFHKTCILKHACFYSEEL
jgi:hypothetical protein